MLFREKSDRLSELTSKRLEVSVALHQGGPPWWIRLKVHNPSAEPIAGCYGQLETQYRSIDSNKQVNMHPRLGPGFKFLWGPGGELNRRHTAIGAYSSDYLHIFGVLEEQPNLLKTPRDDNIQGGRYFLYPLPIGTYEAVISVGSNTVAFAPTKVRITVNFEGGSDLSAELQEV